MGFYLLRRLVWIPVILFVISAVTFVLLRFGPGDPVRLILGQRNDPDAAARIRAEFGLDESPVEQYLMYMGDFVQGDWGRSFKFRDLEVRDLMLPKMAVSFQLGILALLLTFGAGIPVGVYTATRNGRWQDPAAIAGLLLFSSVPVIVMIPIVQFVFVLRLGWFPTAGWDGFFSSKAVLPVLVLGLPGIAGVARLMRALTLDVLDQDYIRTARAKGLSEFAVMFEHVLGNAMLPMITVIGFSLVGVLEGAFFVEFLFGVPGVARFAVESVFNRDYNVIMAFTIITATAFLITSVLVDIGYAMIDPRIRLGQRVQG